MLKVSLLLLVNECHVSCETRFLRSPRQPDQEGPGLWQDSSSSGTACWSDAWEGVLKRQWLHKCGVPGDDRQHVDGTACKGFKVAWRVRSGEKCGGRLKKLLRHCS